MLYQSVLGPYNRACFKTDGRHCLLEHTCSSANAVAEKFYAYACIYRQELGLFHDVIEETLFVIVRSQIKKHISSSCSGTFDKPLMTNLMSWLTDELLSWLEKVTQNLKSSEILCKERLLYYLYDYFVRLRQVILKYSIARS